MQQITNNAFGMAFILLLFISYRLNAVHWILFSNRVPVCGLLSLFMCVCMCVKQQQIALVRFIGNVFGLFCISY